MSPAARLFTGGSRKQETRDCKGTSRHRSEDILPSLEVFWNLRLSCVSFLLTSFFAVLVSSTMGLLSLPLRWVFFTFSFYHRSFAELGSCCVWPPLCGGHAEVVTARLNPSHGTIDVRRVYAPRFCLIHNKDLE